MDETTGTIVGPNKYDTTDPEIIARRDSLINKVINAPKEQVVPSYWEDEEISKEAGFELSPDWKTVPNPWAEGKEITAAAIIGEGEDNGVSVRHFAIIGRREDGALQYYGFLDNLSSNQILMLPPNPNDQFGASNVPWNSLDAKAFLTLAESLLDDSQTPDQQA